MARTRVVLPLLICGELRHAKPDVCIFDRSQNDILLVVQEDRMLESGEPVGARAQLVAEAVAAFEENNAHREAIGLPPLEERVNLTISLSFLRYCSPLGHARHRHGRHVARVFQDSCHPNSVDSYSPWYLPPRGNPRDILLSDLIVAVLKGRSLWTTGVRF